MSEKKNCIRLRIAREDDRQAVAGILAKNGHGVKFTKDYRVTQDGKKGKSLEYFLLVEDVEVGEWK